MDGKFDFIDIEEVILLEMRMLDLIEKYEDIIADFDAAHQTLFATWKGYGSDEYFKHQHHIFEKSGDYVNELNLVKHLLEQIILKYVDVDEELAKISSSKASSKDGNG